MLHNCIIANELPATKLSGGTICTKSSELHKADMWISAKHSSHNKLQ